MRAHLTLFVAERLVSTADYQSIEGNDQLFIEMPARFNVGDIISSMDELFPQEITGLTEEQEYALSLSFHVTAIFWGADKQGVYQDVWCEGD